MSVISGRQAGESPYKPRVVEPPGAPTPRERDPDSHTPAERDPACDEPAKRDPPGTPPLERGH